MFFRLYFWLQVYVLFLFVCLQISCHTTNKRSTLEDVNKPKLYVFSFVNDTFAAYIHQELKQTLNRELNLRNYFSLTKNNNEAEYTIQGRFINFYKQGKLYNSNNEITHAEMQMQVSVSFTNNKTKHPPLTHGFSARRLYTVLNSYGTSEDNVRQQLLYQLADSISSSAESYFVNSRK